MNRREFLKVTGMGAMTVFLSGCGVLGMPGSGELSGKAAKAAEPQAISKGKKLKIVVITGSAHAKGTSAYLADRFIQGAMEAGHSVTRFNAAFEKYQLCTGCDKCQGNGDCIFKDAITDKLMQPLLEADVVALITPLYYYTFSAQIKGVIDRFYSHVQDSKLKGKSAILMATAYNSSEDTMPALVKNYQAILKTLDWQDAGEVLAIGCGARSLIESSKFGGQAYEIGKKL